MRPPHAREHAIPPDRQCAIPHDRKIQRSTPERHPGQFPAWVNSLISRSFAFLILITLRVPPRGVHTITTTLPSRRPTVMKRTSPYCLRESVVVTVTPSNTSTASTKSSTLSIRFFFRLTGSKVICTIDCSNKSEQRPAQGYLLGTQGRGASVHKPYLLTSTITILTRPRFARTRQFRHLRKAEAAIVHECL